MQVTGTFPELSAGLRKSKSAPKSKVGRVMREFKAGKLHSGSKSGPKVTSRKQAIAIGLSEQRKEQGGVGGFSLSRAPKRINAPKTLAGRRAASHKKAYGR